jgi:hypothetical protein
MKITFSVFFVLLVLLCSSQEVIRRKFSPLQQTNYHELDTFSCSISINYILWNGQVYNASDSSYFDVTSNLRTTPKTASNYLFNQDKVEKFKEGCILKIRLFRITAPFGRSQLGRQMNIFIRPKQRPNEIMQIFALSNETDAGHMENGIHYVMDTLAYECADHFLNFEQINKNIDNGSCIIKPGHITRRTRFAVQQRGTIDSVLKHISSRIGSDKKLRKLNRAEEFEKKRQRYSCSDTITISVDYAEGKHKRKVYVFDEDGRLLNIRTEEYRIRWFFKTCHFTPRDTYTCEYNIVGRHFETHFVTE